jgi:hypothetical protein
MSRLNWDSLPADWTFTYNANIIERPYKGRPWVNAPQTEVSITGVIQPMVLECQEDWDSLVAWFDTRSKLVTCPLFYRAPITFEGVTSVYNATTTAINWTGTPYEFSGSYYVGANADVAYGVINPLDPVEWKVDIRPLENGIPFVQPKAGMPYQVGAIPFYVKTRKDNSFFDVILSLTPTNILSASEYVFIEEFSNSVIGYNDNNFSVYAEFNPNVIWRV